MQVLISDAVGVVSSLPAIIVIHYTPAYVLANRVDMSWFTPHSWSGLACFSFAPACNLSCQAWLLACCGNAMHTCIFTTALWVRMSRSQSVCHVLSSLDHDTVL